MLVEPGAEDIGDRLGEVAAAPLILRIGRVPHDAKVRLLRRGQLLAAVAGVRHARVGEGRLVVHDGRTAVGRIRLGRSSIGQRARRVAVGAAKVRGRERVGASDASRVGEWGGRGGAHAAVRERLQVANGRQDRAGAAGGEAGIGIGGLRRVRRQPRGRFPQG